MTGERLPIYVHGGIKRKFDYEALVGGLALTDPSSLEARAPLTEASSGPILDSPHAPHSGLRDLRNLFDRRIGAREIAVPLVSFDEGANAAGVNAFMSARSFDVVGVRRDGLCRGYYVLDQDATGTLPQHVVAFTPDVLVHEDSPLPDVIAKLQDAAHLFVRALGEIVAIVSRADLHKPAVRMWLFSLCSLAEVQMLRLVQLEWPKDTWIPRLSQSRLDAARRLFDERRQRDEELTVLDCLQMADKRDLILKAPGLPGRLGYESKTLLERQLRLVERIRNLVAHSQSLDVESWSVFFEGTAAAERFLDAAERLEETRA